MIGLPSFRLHRPTSIEEAVGLLAEHRDDAKLLAGGTDLLVNLRHGLATPSHIVSLAEVPGLDRIDCSPEHGLTIGALSTLESLATHPGVEESFPVVVRAARTISGPTLRAMGTVGGNLCLDTRCHWYNQSFFWRQACGFCLKKDGTACHVAPGSSLCWAAYSGDLAPAFLVLGAEIKLLSVRGERRVPLDRFFLDDGLRKFDMASDELLTQVCVSATRAHLRGVYSKLRIRGALDYPLAGVAAAARIAGGGTFHEAALALTAVGPRPFLVEGATEILEGLRANDEDAIERVAHLARRLSNPMNTTWAMQPAYRRLRVGLFARDALREMGERGP